MKPSIVTFEPLLAEPTLDRPRPDRLVQGDPLRKTWTLYESGQGGAELTAGVWACEVGAWRIAFPVEKEEYFFVLEGRVRLTDLEGQVQEIAAGQGAIIPAGFEGVFEVVEPVRKHFVVLERTPQA